VKAPTPRDQSTAALRGLDRRQEIMMRPGLVVNDDDHRRLLKRTRSFCPGSMVTNASPRGTLPWRGDPFTETNYGRRLDGTWR
jgi:hypothetical protein